MPFEIRAIRDGEIVMTEQRDTYRQATRERSRMLKSGDADTVTMLEYPKGPSFTKDPNPNCTTCHGTGWWTRYGYDAEQPCGCRRG